MAEDDTEQKYTVTVQVEGMPAPKEVPASASYERKILSFKFPDLNPEVIGQIDEEQQIIMLIVPPGTDRRAMRPVIRISDKATIEPASGSPQDFRDYVRYKVTPENKSWPQYYTVRVIEDFPATTARIARCRRVNFEGANFRTDNMTFENSEITVFFINQTTKGEVLVPALRIPGSSKIVTLEMPCDIPLGVYKLKVVINGEEKLSSWTYVVVEKGNKTGSEFPF